MRQTVAVGVIKATTKKEVSGTKTKAAEKAVKKKRNTELGQQQHSHMARQEIYTFSRKQKRHPASHLFLTQPSFRTLFFANKLVSIVKYGVVRLYFHRKEFRRINLLLPFIFLFSSSIRHWPNICNTFNVILSTRYFRLRMLLS